MLLFASLSLALAYRKPSSSVSIYFIFSATCLHAFDRDTIQRRNENFVRIDHTPGPPTFIFVHFFPLSEELEEEKVAVVSLYPGIVKTEKMVGLMTKSPKDFEANVRRVELLCDASVVRMIQNLCCFEIISGLLTFFFVSEDPTPDERNST